MCVVQVLVAVRSDLLGVFLLLLLAAEPVVLPSKLLTSMQALTLL
jgi:hypothetical protein